MAYVCRYSCCCCCHWRLSRLGLVNSRHCQNASCSKRFFRFLYHILPLFFFSLLSLLPAQFFLTRAFLSAAASTTTLRALLPSSLPCFSLSLLLLWAWLRWARSTHTHHTNTPSFLFSFPFTSSSFLCGWVCLWLVRGEPAQPESDFLKKKIKKRDAPTAFLSGPVSILIQKLSIANLFVSLTHQR